MVVVLSKLGRFTSGHRFLTIRGIAREELDALVDWELDGIIGTVAPGPREGRGNVIGLT